MSTISILSLRSPENAAYTIDAGARDLAIQAVEKFHATQQLLKKKKKNSCLVIQNLVVKNAKTNPVSCCK
jgi:hypothetical protein